ncbi:hypothetical protein Tco_0233809 [Tanacetum coccineum]
MKHISESFHIKGITLLVHLESDVLLLIGNCSPEFLYVNGRDTCCDQEGWIKRSERENIQSNLKCGFLGLECGAQSIVATANHLRIRGKLRTANSYVSRPANSGITKSANSESYSEDVHQLIRRIDKVKFDHTILNMFLDKVKYDVYMLLSGMLNVVAT